MLAKAPAAAIAIRQQFRVSMPDPTDHLFGVELRLTELDPERPLVLKMAVWTPGSYLVREYARQVQDFEVTDAAGRALPWRKINKHTWEVAQPSQTAVIRYRVYAYELTVRTNHLDTTHGFFNGAALLLYMPERRQEPIALTIVPPKPDWRVATSLPPCQGSELTFVAQNYDELVDSPVEVGIHQAIDFEVLGKVHRIVVWGAGNLDLPKAAQDVEKIVATAADFFGGLPYPSYWFIIHLSADGFGGLEHKCSAVLNYSRFDLQDPEKYQRFLALVAHEFFHVWNVKRLRPKALETFDYEQENYLESLWFCEGATSYYENLILLRAGLIAPATFLQLLAQAIARLQRIPGRAVQPLAESSFDTWIKLYRPHENSTNSQVSYYLKGELVCWLLDLELRRRTNGSGSFDRVLLDLWERFGRHEKGYTDAELRAAFEGVAGADLKDFFDRYLYGTLELDYDSFLAPFGLQLVLHFSHPNPAPYVGIHFGEGSKIGSVDIGSPAQRAGIWAGDELVALNGFKVTPQLLLERWREIGPHHPVALTVFQNQELKTFWIPADPPRPDLYTIEALPNPDPEQKRLYQGWLEAFRP